MKQPVEMDRRGFEKCSFAVGPQKAGENGSC